VVIAKARRTKNKSIDTGNVNFENLARARFGRTYFLKSDQSQLWENCIYILNVKHHSLSGQTRFTQHYNNSFLVMYLTRCQ